MKFTISALLSDGTGIRLATAQDAMNFSEALRIGELELALEAPFIRKGITLAGWDIRMDDGQDDDPNYQVASKIAPIPNAWDRNPYDRRN